MKFLSFFLSFLLGCSVCQGSGTSPADIQGFVTNIMSQHRTALESFIPRIITSPPSPSYYEKEPRLDFISCEACTAGLGALKLLRDLAIPKSFIIQVVVGGCYILQIADYDMCRGAVHGFGYPILRMIDDKPELSVADVCGTLIDECGVPDPSLADWDIPIPGNKPPVTTPPLLPEGIPSAQILQFTDIHLDLHYRAGSDVDCGKPEGCCRTGDGTKGSAGPFGDFGCSLPQKSVDAMFEDAKANTSPKYIFLTGDYIHSAIWEYSVAENTPHFEYVTRTLAATFPGVPVFPLVGNHEPHVVNMFSPESLWPIEEFDLAWMYEVISAPFNLPPDALLTFKKGGFYTIRPDPASPFRVVALNTNLCYLQNFWLVYDTVDPTGQLQWMTDTLDLAEKAGEIVHIIGHIKPASGSCWKVWSEKYARIINRYEGIIKAQYFGHAHRESFNLAFDGDRAISVSYISPAMVTDGGNPSYKVFYVDGARNGATWELMDHETRILNLRESNGNPNGLPVIESLYKAKEYFGLESLRPEAYYDFVRRMRTDTPLFQKYWRSHHRGSPIAGICGDDDMECRWGYLCDMMRSHSADVSACDRLRDPGATTTTIATTSTTTAGTGSTRTTTEQGGGGTGSEHHPIPLALTLLLASLLSFFTTHF